MPCDAAPCVFSLRRGLTLWVRGGAAEEERGGINCSREDLRRHRLSYPSVCLYMRVSHVATATLTTLPQLYIRAAGGTTWLNLGSLYANISCSPKRVSRDFCQFGIPLNVLRRRQFPSVPLWQTNLQPDDDRRGWGSKGWREGVC